MVATPTTITYGHVISALGVTTQGALNSIQVSLLGGRLWPHCSNQQRVTAGVTGQTPLVTAAILNHKW
jgi:hypothetical protein